MGLYTSNDAEEAVEKVEAGKTFYIKVKESNPSTASMKYDKIEIKNVHVLEGKINLTKESFKYDSSSAYYYAKASNTGKVKVEFESTVNKIAGEIIIEVIPPKPTSIEPYVGGSYLYPSKPLEVRIDDEIVLSGKVFPQGALQNYIIEASNDNVQLTKQEDGSYIMKVVSKAKDNGTVTLTWNTEDKSLASPTTRVVNIKDKLTEKLSLDKLKELFKTGTYHGTTSIYKEHIFTFKEDNTGRAEFTGTNSNYGYIDFTYEIIEENDAFVIKFTITDKSHDKWVEGNVNILNISISKDSDGQSFTCTIDGTYRINAQSYVWAANS